MAQHPDDQVARAARYYAGYVVSSWWRGLVLGEVTIYPDGTGQARPPEVWQLLDTPHLQDRPPTADPTLPPVLQSPRHEDEIHRRLAAIVYEVGSGTPDLAEQLADVDHPDLAIVRALLSKMGLARATTLQKALAHYIKKTQRFLEDPVIEELLWHVEQTLLIHRQVTGPALTQILESLAPRVQGFLEDAP
jgi:hypothetical protein